MEVPRPRPNNRHHERVLLLNNGGIEYITLKKIGYWRNPKATVFEATQENKNQQEEESRPNVALAVVNQRDGIYNTCIRDAERNENLYHANILRIHEKFLFEVGENNNEECVALVIPCQEVVSIRCLLDCSAKVKGRLGVQEDCCAIILKHALIAVSEIHRVPGEMHRQINAGNIFYHRQDETIKLAFAGSIFERTPPKWRCLDHCAIPPEVEHGTEEVNYTPKSDIWLLGILALELAYGEVHVQSRDKLLNITSYVSTNRHLPSTWKELTMACGEANKGSGGGSGGRGAGKPNNKKQFSEPFVKLVAMCLTDNPYQRPTAEYLLQSKIFNSVKSIQFFKKSAVDDIFEF